MFESHSARISQCDLRMPQRGQLAGSLEIRFFKPTTDGLEEGLQALLLLLLLLLLPLR